MFPADRFPLSTQPRHEDFFINLLFSSVLSSSCSPFPIDMPLASSSPSPSSFLSVLDWSLLVSFRWFPRRASTVAAPGADLGRADRKSSRCELHKMNGNSMKNAVERRHRVRSTRTGER